MTGRRDDLDVQWLQLPADLVNRKAAQLAALLEARAPKKLRVSEGDALLIVVRLWQAVLDRVREDAPDIRAGLENACSLPGADMQVLAVACRWPASHAADLFTALAHPSVAVVEEAPDGWRVIGMADRYAGLAETKEGNRGRTAATRLAKKHGLAKRAEGGWMHPGTGELFESWQAVLAAYGAKETA